MSIMTLSRITELHAARTARGAGFAPPLEECLAAAASGRLYDVDTQNRGADGLTIADSEDAALSEIAEHEEPEEAATHEGGSAGWARARHWTAERITLSERARLADLDPREMGRQAVRRVLRHIANFAPNLSSGLMVTFCAPRPDGQSAAEPSDDALDKTELAHTVAALTVYAQRGQWTLDDQSHELAAGEAVAKTGILLSANALGISNPLSAIVLSGDESSEDPMRLLLTGAWARVALARGCGLSTAQLAVLVGMHPSAVRALRSRGEIRGWIGKKSGRGATPCPPDVARRWLAARGVEGLE